MEHHSVINTVDFIVLGTLLASGVLAFWRGFVRELVSLIAWSGAFFAAALFYPIAKPWVHQHIHSEMGTTLATALGLFCLALVVLMVIGGLIASLVKGRTLTAIDRSLGFVFGLVRGTLIVSLIYLAATSFLWPDIDKPDNPDHAPALLITARTRPMMEVGADILKGFMPQGQIMPNGKHDFAAKAAAEHMIEVKKLQMLSTPVVAGAKPDSGTYDAKSRAKLDRLIDQTSKQ